MPFFIFLAIGLGVGVVSGLLGIGGGVLLIPLLIWLSPDIDQPRAAGITLAVLAVPVALPAALEYYRNGTITNREIFFAIWIALGFAIGGWTGAHFRPWVPVAALRVLFGLLLVYIAVRLIVVADSEAARAAIGLGAVAVAWLGYWRLKALGHMHLNPPLLVDKIRETKPQEPPEGDYYI